MSMLPEKHMLWNLVALYAPRGAAMANAFNTGLYELQSRAQLQSLITPYSGAAPAAAQRASSRVTAAHFFSAAWRGDAGRLIAVADRSPPAVKSGAKVPALYTEDQATKGELQYYQNCSMCHGPNLDGQEGGYSGPALKGADFADPSYDFHVSDIFNFVAKQMPAATPGSLSHEVDVQIMAFILKQNGYPAGTKELVYEEAEKSTVPIRYHGK
jgi:mono/diheme cytochrome c family protein